MPAPFTFTRVAALFQSLTFPESAVVFTMGPHDNETLSIPGYVRVSEWVAVEFKPLDQDHSKAVVDALQDQKRALEAEYVKKLDDVDGKIIRAMAFAPTSLTEGK